jgi:phenylalanyl-tRNA synthetase beta chain
MKAIWAAETGGVLRDAVLFDVYRGKTGASSQHAAGASMGETGSEKSLAIRLRFNSDVATLTESQIDTATNAVIETLTSTCGARLRG